MKTSLAAKPIRYRLCASRGRACWPCSGFRRRCGRGSSTPGRLGFYCLPDAWFGGRM